MNVYRRENFSVDRYFFFFSTPCRSGDQHCLCSVWSGDQHLPLQRVNRRDRAGARRVGFTVQLDDDVCQGCPSSARWSVVRERGASGSQSNSTTSVRGVHLQLIDQSEISESHALTNQNRRKKPCGQQQQAAGRTWVIQSAQNARCEQQQNARGEHQQQNARVNINSRTHGHDDDDAEQALPALLVLVVDIRACQRSAERNTDWYVNFTIIYYFVLSVQH